MSDILLLALASFSGAIGGAIILKNIWGSEDGNRNILPCFFIFMAAAIYTIALVCISAEYKTPINRDKLSFTEFYSNNKRKLLISYRKSSTILEDETAIGEIMKKHDPYKYFLKETTEYLGSTGFVNIVVEK